MIIFPLKVASLKHQRHAYGKQSKKAAVAKQRRTTEHAQERASRESSGEEEGSGDSEQEQRPPTPTKSKFMYPWFSLHWSEVVSLNHHSAFFLPPLGTAKVMWYSNPGK